uniref:Chitin-binding type-2 domain-containing protein n=1 Tax=Anopheles atroparvus TaxID=41427 RepID=A0A182JLI8_ANOAO
MATGRISLAIVTCTALLLLPGIDAQVFDPMVICQGKPDDTTVMNPVSCDLFMLCKNNLPAETGQCPDNMLFNAEAGYCDFPNNVDCGTVPRPPGFEQTTGTPMVPTTTPTPEITETPGESCPEIDDPVVPTYLPVLEDCSLYVLCYHGNPLTMKCPAGLEWNIAESTCDTPENAKCQAIFKDPYGCPEDGIVFLPHPDECRKFVFCLNGISRVQICQMFKLFDPIVGECVVGTC